MYDVCTDEEMVDLLQRARHNEPAALDRLYRLYVHKVYRYIWYRVGDQATAEDLTGEVFVRMVQHIHRFRVPGEHQVAAFSAWLFRIAGNCLSDHHRSEAYSRAHAEPSAPPVADGDSWDRSLDRLLQRHDLLAAMNRLSDDQRQVLYYRFVADLTSAQTAAVMGKQEGAIKALQHRALNSLRRLLEEKSEGRT
ncbi:MAG: sigma-70 family RNA polymerase sigma factor [Anaerolineae bacterium]|nr:sigma-70 family RNA polymerase sigma factor [Caldilineales bacterium]MCX7854210.1 sigma-70 family RNA polymerase sigma factor [Caldilineales bacterium]MDW8269635.1 sigma-70 family RNA polymerase sigma factor [Anaerolineae bacterium]